MSDEDRRKLIQKFGKVNFGVPVKLKSGRKCKKNDNFIEPKPISAFNMARRV
jgi:hypothetical protein